MTSASSNNRLRHARPGSSCVKLVVCCGALLLFPILLLVQPAGAQGGSGPTATPVLRTAPSKNLITSGTSITMYLPLVAKILAPPATTSRYMQTITPAILYNEGCSQGIVNQRGIIVLDFGSPRSLDSTFGTLLFGLGGYASTAQIEAAAEGFLYGYWLCSPPGSYIQLAIGTNNCGNGSGPSRCNPGGDNVTSAHGQAWAQAVRNIGKWIIDNNYASRVSIAGASDMEPGWNSPSETKNWVDGYFLSAKRDYALFNFGSCDSCVYFACPSCMPPNGWSYDDIWYVSWGAPLAYPFPEIYATSGANADQWYRMSLYAFNNHGSSMNFVGSFTEWQACQDVDPIGCADRHIDNTPSAGWGQLYDAINANPVTAQPLLNSTDITWQQ